MNFYKFNDLILDSIMVEFDRGRKWNRRKLRWKYSIRGWWYCLNVDWKIKICIS